MQQQLRTMQDEMRVHLSSMEDEVLKTLDALTRETGTDQRWLVIARTDIQKGFMAAKRALYEGKRVGDP